MRFFYGVLFFFYSMQLLFGQQTVTGKIWDNKLDKEVANAIITLEGTTLQTNSAADGTFELQTTLVGEFIIQISAIDYLTKRLPITLEKTNLDLGVLLLEKDLTLEKTENLIALTDSDLSNDESSSITSGLLQATKDIFLNRAAFDFGQAFFRVRGYGSEHGKVLLNGIPMNKFYDGRPQWNNWGGLNDVTKNQDFTHGIQASEHNFGGLLGTTNINTRPSGLRPGTRFSTSASNRTYAGRVMATYNSGMQKNGLAYSVSASRRWANEGYIAGTLYDAFSLYGALEYQINQKHSLNFTGFYASNRRGRSSAVTEETFNLLGRKYNPYWGNQNGKIRNSRERKIAEPVVMLNHYYKSNNLNLNTGVLYQFGSAIKSRLGYYNAPNPDPTYYRYLPSYYINSPIGANFESAATAKEALLENPQINWERVYTANQNTSNSQAAYVLYDDAIDDQLLAVNSIGNIKIGENGKADFGITYKKLKSENYAKIQDLLGADFHEDIDTFSNTENDINGSLVKNEGEIFNYHYNFEASSLEGFAQYLYEASKWNAFLSANFNTTSYQREGKFKNERFMASSLGKSDKVDFSNFGAKVGFTYKITGRHWVNVHGAYINQAPILQNVFINPREHNVLVNDVKSENNTTIDFNYYLRLPKLTGRFSGFYTRFMNATDVNFFFVESGVGSDFVQEVVTNLDKLHKGFELGLEYQISSTVKLSAVGALGKYTYASDPEVNINFDTAGAEEDIINTVGTIDLGISKVKDYNLSQGPQKAFAFGVEYRDPKYWWVGASANFLGNNYANISTIVRTDSFYLDPETGEPFLDATSENVNTLLQQQKLGDFYLLNLVGGKSWLKNNKYISVFASVNNVFDVVYKTGGYEQSRNGNYGQLAQDNLSGSPSFGPKYWYGYGRTYFLNVAISF